MVTMKLINYEDKSLIKRHCGTLLREEGGVLEAERYKRDRGGMC